MCMDLTKIHKRNKAMMITQGYIQVEGIDFNKTFTLVACLESIHILLAITRLLNFRLYQINVKSTILNIILQEDVFVEQSKSFINHLYGLKQAHRVWYERLAVYLLEHDIFRGKVDKTLFIRKCDKQLLIFEIYVDNIAFGATLDSLSYDFTTKIKYKFEISMISELNLCFLGYISKTN